MTTHNIREVAEIVEKMLAIGWDSKMKKHDGTSIVVSFTKAELCELLLNIEENHYHQLQKARVQEKERIKKIVMILGTKNMANGAGIYKMLYPNEIIEAINHSELDQDNK